MKKKNNEGFSLVELIIVIAIMAVLVIVLAPTFLKFVEKGRETTDMDNVTMVKEAIQVYVADHGVKGSETFIVTMKSGENDKITVTGTGVKNNAILKEYGIDDVSKVADVTSEAWVGTLTMTYKDYAWTGNDAPTDGVHADYYWANGEEYTAPSGS